MRRAAVSCALCNHHQLIVCERREVTCLYRACHPRYTCLLHSDADSSILVQVLYYNSHAPVQLCALQPMQLRPAAESKLICTMALLRFVQPLDELEVVVDGALHGDLRMASVTAGNASRLTSQAPHTTRCKPRLAGRDCCSARCVRHSIRDHTKCRKRCAVVCVRLPVFSSKRC